MVVRELLQFAQKRNHEKTWQKLRSNYAESCSVAQEGEDVMILDLLITCLFCAVLWRFGTLEVINGKFVALGLFLWLIGYMEGSRKWKDVKE